MPIALKHSFPFFSAYGVADHRSISGKPVPDTRIVCVSLSPAQSA